MAENDNPRPIVVQLRQMRGDRSHGHQLRSFKVANGVLLRLPNIDHPKRDSGLPEFVDFRRGYLNWQFIHRRRV